ncbi:MAG: cyclic nucleotide-binding domain-containing protein [Endomicrobiia bacterium]|nr:cyclic nucleotide-binding domain-containing protein [Endomicrobiia bacterium]
MPRTLTQEEVAWLFKNLRKVNFFSKVTLDNIDSVVEKFRAYSYPKGKAIIKEGVSGGALYIIKSGECEVTKKKGWFGSARLAALKEGDFFGEMSLVSDEPATATVGTLAPCEIFVLLKNDFLTIKSGNKELSDEIDYIIERRKFDTSFAK